MDATQRSGGKVGNFKAGSVLERAASVCVPKLRFDVDAITRPIEGPVALAEWIERRIECEPGVWNHPWSRPLIIDRVGSRVVADDFKSVGGIVPLLPEPEYPVY